MANKLSLRIRGAIKKRPILIVIFYLLLVLCAVIASRNSWEDYLTTLNATQWLPTRHATRLWFEVGGATDFEILVSAIPQLVQLVVGYIALEKQSRRLGGLVVLAFLVDIATDVFYKSAGLGWGVFAIAIAESVVVSFLFSEVALLFCISNLIDYWPLFWASFGGLLSLLWLGATSIWQGASERLEEEDGAQLIQERVLGQTTAPARQSPPNGMAQASRVHRPTPRVPHVIREPRYTDEVQT